MSTGPELMTVDRSETTLRPAPVPVRVFISYCREDRAAAWQVRAVLERYGDSLQVWLDDSLEGGERYARRIYEEIERAHAFIALLSDRWMESEWCRREAQHAFARHQAGQSVILVPCPIEIDESGEFSGVSQTSLASFQAVDLSRWRTHADTTIRELLIPLLLPELCPRVSLTPLVGQSVVSSAVGLLSWAASSPVPERVQRGLIALAYDWVGDPRNSDTERAMLLDAVAGLHLTRREWNDMAAATSAALELLEGKNRRVEVPGTPAPVAHERLIGELLLRLALGGRQQSDRRARRHAEAAASRFEALGDPLERADKLAQVQRELGTWSQSAGDLEAARQHFLRSARLLEGLPSQRFHVLQAHVKIAQVELLGGDYTEADRILAALRDEFPAEATLHPLMTQVLPHFLVTDALCNALLGRDERATPHLDRLEASPARRGLPRGNQLRAILIRALLGFPLFLRRRLFTMMWAFTTWPGWRSR